MALTRQLGFREAHKPVTNIFPVTFVSASWFRYTIRRRRRTLPQLVRSSSTNRGLKFGVGNPQSSPITTNFPPIIANFGTNRHKGVASSPLGAMPGA